METGVGGMVMGEAPLVNIGAMARIVHELVTGGPACWRDCAGLRHRAVSDGLGIHECAALEELRRHLCQGTAALTEAAAIRLGNW